MHIYINTPHLTTYNALNIHIHLLLVVFLPLNTVMPMWQYGTPHLEKP